MIAYTLAALFALALPSHPPAPRHVTPPRPQLRARDVYNGRANQIHVRLPRLNDAEAVVDGQLDEPQWAQAALLTG